ncbi:MAG: hypothetical protein K1X38_17845 [Microthrixaceae bacterium]|nr:hypothetical protein [Microthrixaceae bacterium]
MRQRRTALRFAFRLARAVGAIAWDPTADIELPPRGTRRVRPLTDDEVDRCRSAALWSLEDTRRAAAFALAEATARSSEIAYALVRDVHLEEGRVWLHGGKVTRPRWGQLTPWGIEQMTRRLDDLDGGPDQPIVYSGRKPAEAGQVASCAAVTDVLRRAGLASQPDVRAGSVAGWAGRKILEETGRIDVVAHGLGMASLDRVADIISWDWRSEGPP